MPRGRGGSHRRHRLEGAMSTCNLPKDVIADILSRLPVKLLLRFRCVCKPWRNLLANPKFISLHHHHTTENADEDTLLVHSSHDASTKPLISLLRTAAIPNPPAAIPNLHHPFPATCVLYDMDVAGSTNGLVVLSSPPLSSLIMLWNPATKQYKGLRHGTILHFPMNAFDKVSIGFAFDSVANDYKIMKVICFKTESGLPNRAEVYSANAGTWREISVDIPYYFCESKCDVVVKGVPYWLVCPKDEAEFKPNFLWFDVGDEVFRQLPVPSGIAVAVNDRTCRLVVNLKDSLAVLVYSAAAVPVEDSNTFVDVWVMENCDGVSSWSKKFTVGPILGVETLVGCSKNGKIVAENSEGMLVLYDPDTEEVKNVPINGALAQSFLVCSYSESLVPIRESVQVGKLDKMVLGLADELHKRIAKDRKNGCCLMCN